MMQRAEHEVRIPVRCLREPIAEIFAAARILDAAVSAHLAGDRATADGLIRQTNTPVIRNYVESMWGVKSPYVKVMSIPGSPPFLNKAQRIETRMPGTQIKRELIARDGYHCRFCGVPLVTVEVRKRMRAAYPEALPWGTTNTTQHAAFQAMWLQYDHILPHARGGANELDNLVIACAPCNYSRMNWTLEEVGLLDPPEREPVLSEWDGLQRFH